ncbi:MAG: recombinase family protein, partial [Jatrophihabitans sp.]
MPATRSETRSTTSTTPKLRVVRVAVYLRQSYDSALRAKITQSDPSEIDPDETAIRRAVRRQLDACTEWIANNSTPRVRYEVVEVYEDNDVSATRKRVRPAFAKMLADAEAGHFDLILSYHLDRLT